MRKLVDTAGFILQQERILGGYIDQNWSADRYLPQAQRAILIKHEITERQLHQVPGPLQSKPQEAIPK